jgi:hypothetical protein
VAHYQHGCRGDKLLFNLEHDHGHVIEGYIIPDGFSDEATIRVSDIDGDIAILPCDQLKQAVIDSRRHASGLVGFRLDESVIEGIAERKTLAIHDVKTGLLIYRRPQIENPVQMKIIRLETQLLPMVKFDVFCGHHFQYQLSSMERFGHETTLQAFHLNAVNSIYLSGRLMLRNYEEFFDKGFQGIVLLTDPFYELALRIFLLKRMATTKISFLGERDQILLAPAAEHFADIKLDDETALKNALKKAPQKVRNMLISPVTRQLACTFPEQLTTHADIAPAIDLLSRFAIIGHSSDVLHFQRAVGELLDVPVEDLPLPPRHMALEELSARLKSLHVAELLLEQDLIFDHYVRNAMKTAAPRRAQMNVEPHV